MSRSSWPRISNRPRLACGPVNGKDSVLVPGADVTSPRVYVIEDGEIVYGGSKAEFETGPSHQGAHLAV